MRATLSTFSFMLVSLAAVSVQAFDYDESVSGDLVDFDVPRLFDFDMGENVVSGSTSISFEPESGDFDLFAFSLPTGSQLSSVVFSYSSLSMSGPWVAIGVNPSLRNRASDGTWLGNPISSVVVPIFTDGQTADFVPQPSPVVLNLKNVVGGIVTGEATLPLGGGPYVFDAGPAINGIRYSGSTATVSWNYSYRFTVIPEPGTGLLVALGLVGLGRCRTRRNL